MEEKDVQDEDRKYLENHFKDVFSKRRELIKTIRGKITEPEDELLKRTEKHVINVSMGARWLVRHGLASIGDNDVLELEENIENHDLSKIMSPDEFDAYANYHFPHTDDKEKLKAIKEAYQEAKVHHQNSNKHHSEYWVKIDDNGNVKPLDMDMLSIVEMICDWWSFNWDKGDLQGIFDWYDSKKDKIIMSPQTKRIVERILDGIKKELKNER